MHFLRHKQVPRVFFLAVGTQWSFSEITVAKPSLQRTFLMWFVSPIANQDILNQNWQNNVFRIMGKTLLSVNAKIGSPVFLRQFRQLSNSYHCLVYALLENLNQISRTEKCHFAVYIFHEQRFYSFTSKFVKSRVVAWWCFFCFVFVLFCLFVCLFVCLFLFCFFF